MSSTWRRVLGGKRSESGGNELRDPLIDDDGSSEDAYNSRSASAPSSGRGLFRSLSSRSSSGSFHGRSDSNSTSVNNAASSRSYSPALGKEFKKSKGDGGDDDLPEKGFFALYSYASCFDKFLVFVGILSACGTGSILPINSVVLGHIFSGNSADTNNLASNIGDAIPSLMILGGASFVLNNIQFNCFMRSAERIARNVKETCFKKLLEQEVGYFDTEKPGVLVGSITEQSNLILGGVGDKLGVAIQFLAQFVAGFAIAYYNCWKVALVMTACMPAIALTVAILIFMVVKFIKRSTNSYEEASGVAEEVLSQMQTVASFSGEKKAIEKYDEKLREAETAGVTLSIIRGMGLGILFLSIFLTYGVGYWYGSRLIATGEVDFGTVLTSVLACVIGSISIGIAAPNISAVAQAKAGSAAIHKLIDRQSSILAKEPGRDSSPVCIGRLSGTVEFIDVRFRYPSRPDALALGGLTMCIPTGKTCALVGSSGCGKSTCIALLQRFYDAEGGSVRIDGVDVRDYSLLWLREQMALVGQEPVLFDVSIADNIRYGNPKASIHQVVEAAKDANAHEFIVSFPDGYNTKVGARGCKLSGGQKQRVAIARALIRDPSILLLDEATSALDNESERIVQAAIDEMLQKHKRTTIIIAHRLSTVRNADQIIVLNNNGGGGHVVEQGSHDALMAKESGAYRQLVKMQMHTSESAPSDASSPIPVERTRSQGSVADQAQRRASVNDQLDVFGPASDILGVLTSSGVEGRNSGLSSEMLLSDNPIDDDVLSYFTARAPADDVEAAKGPPKVPMRRVWNMNRPELKLFFIGLFGAAIKGSSQPLMAIIVSHIMTGLVLIPNFVDPLYAHFDPLDPSNHSYDFDPLCSLDGSSSRFFNPCNKPHQVCIDVENFASSIPNITEFEKLKLFNPKTMGICGLTCNGRDDPFCASKSSSSFCADFSLFNINGGKVKHLCAYGYVPDHDPDDVRATGVLSLWIYALIGSCAALGVALQTGLFGIMGEKLTKRLRLLVFSSLVKQDSAFFDDEDHSVGSLLSRLSTDATLVKATTGEYSGLMFENAVSLAVALGIAFVASWNMTVIVMLPMPLLVLSAWFQHRSLVGLNRTGLEAQQRSGQILAEALNGVRTVYSFNAESKVCDIYSGHLEEPMRAGYKNALICGLGGGTSQLLFFSVYSFAFWWGGQLLTSKGFGPPLSATDLSRVFFALTLSATAIGQSSARASDSTKGMAAKDQIFALADRAPNIDPTSAEGKIGLKEKRSARITFKDVTFRYPSRPDVCVLRNFNCEILPGQTVAFVGASGSGKSSVIKLLERFYDPDFPHDDSGIFVNGILLSKMNLKWWRGQLGLVGQEPVLFQGTLAENISYGIDSSMGTVSRDMIVKAAKDANAHDFILDFPDGYETDVGSKGAQLSGGQKQRIAIARALIRDPLLLLLDEATSALDSESESVVQAALDRLMASNARTTIVVAHRLSTIQGADNIIVLGNDGYGGKVLEQGTHEQLMTVKGGHYAHLASMTVRT